MDVVVVASAVVVVIFNGLTECYIMFESGEPPVINRLFSVDDDLTTHSLKRPIRGPAQVVQNAVVFCPSDGK